MIVGIYGFRSSSDGKWYIGQSIDVAKRRRCHLSELRLGKHHNIHLQRAFTKFGADNFEFHILEEVEAQMLDAREKAWIVYLKSANPLFGYNLDGGGQNERLISEQTRKKIADSRRGKPAPEHIKRLLYSYSKGRVVSPETRLKMSLSQKGRPSPLRGRKGLIPNAETRAKIGAANRLRRVTGETRNRMSASAKIGWKKRRDRST